MDYFYNHTDKWFHFLISGMFAVWLLGAKTKKQAWIGLFICFVVAASKELIYDLWLGNGNAEWLDFWFTITLPILVSIFKILSLWNFGKN